ncbi:MAG: LysR family transcriptional regulator, partial [Ottowia sp.]|nr:LysR family transcriptional regulator [Ottowia sp.]
RRLASRLRFRHLQLLVALRDHGSLHAAAEALSLTQPSLSKMLKEIELSFGRPLFERSARGVAPTPAGAVVLHGAALLLDELERLGREA